jgi:hypothetical protein
MRLPVWVSQIRAIESRLTVTNREPSLLKTKNLASLSALSMVDHNSGVADRLV